MNAINRGAIIVLAAVAIILMAVVVFLAWAADTETVGRLDDLVQYLGDHTDDASKLILTLGALTLVVLAVLVVIVELAPEQEAAELRVEQAGATTIVSSEALRQRLEEALLTLPAITAAKVSVASRNNAIATSLDLTVAPDANVATATQDASRMVTQTVQDELGLPVADTPRFRVTFGAREVPPTGEPAASAETRPETRPSDDNP